MAAATGAAGLYGWHGAAAPDPRVASLLARARAALRDELPEGTHEGIELLREATRLAPDDAKAWGLLAIALRDTLDFAPAGQIAAMVSSSEQAIARSLAIDPDQPDAQAAQALLPPIFGDWTGAEKRLNTVLARHPDQPDALEGLGVLLMSTGRIRDAADISARLARSDPLSPVYQFRDAYRQWSLGDLGGADRTIDRALQLWPRHPAVCYTRFLIFALSGRVEAAQRMLRPDAGAPVPVAAFALDGWNKSLLAMRSGTAPDRAAAVVANLSLARTGVAGCTNALLALTGAGALDAAFEVANGFLLHQGPLAGAIAAPGLGRLWFGGEAAYAQALDQQKRWVTNAQSTQKAPGVLLLLGHAGGKPLIAGKDTAADWMLQQAGGRNLATHTGYKPFSVESLAGLSPDVLVFADRALAGEAARSALFKENPILTSTPAAKHGRVFEVDPTLLVGGLGPRLPQSLAALSAGFYPSPAKPAP